MSEYKLTWITADLAAGYAPMSYADLDSIRNQGVAAIVNLCGEYCDLHDIEEKSGFEVFYLPIPDECAPDMVALEKGLAWVDDVLYQGKKVLVHCRFGIGRTGTFITAFLIRRGLGLKVAKKKLKKSRSQPATYQQWKMLKKYSKTCSLNTIREPSLEKKNVVDLTSYFQQFDKLIDEIEVTLDRQHEKASPESACGKGDHPCCFGYFELSLIEAVYLFHHINRSMRLDLREAVVHRATERQDTIRNLKKGLADEGGTHEPSGALFENAYRGEKIKCPLNYDVGCLCFDHRPVRCRVEGVDAHILVPLKIDNTLAHISRHLFWALSGILPDNNALSFSVAETVSGQFIQDYFSYLVSL